MLTRALKSKWWVIFLVANCLLVTITVITRHLLHYPYIKTFIDRPFSLVHEMSFATWWSGACLLLVALMTFQLSASSKINLKIAWILLTVIFTGLSFDEIGSIHERMQWIENWSGIKYFFVLITLIAASSIATLCFSSITRKTGLLIFAGFSFYAGVILLELLEQGAALPSWAYGLRAGAEEGLELFGTFMILAGVILQRGPMNQSFLEIVPEPKKMRGLIPVVLAGLILHLVLCIVLPIRVDLSSQGNPLVWFPMVVFVLMACQAFWSWRRSTNTYARRWGNASILFLLCSVNTNYPILRIIPKILRVLTFEQTVMIFYVIPCAILLARFKWMVNDEQFAT